MITEHGDLYHFEFYVSYWNKNILRNTKFILIDLKLSE